jgi:hypothetical protein
MGENGLQQRLTVTPIYLSMPTNNKLKIDPDSARTTISSNLS